MFFLFFIGLTVTAHKHLGSKAHFLKICQMGLVLNFQEVNIR